MNELYAHLAARLRRCQRVLITTHVRPDGDAVGSTAAIHAALRQTGIASRVLLLSHLPTKYAFVYRDLEVDCFDVEDAWPADFSLADYDALIAVDTGTWDQLPGLQARVEAFSGGKYVLDHHLTQQDWADARVVDTSAAAAGEMALRLLHELGTPLTPEIAQALYVAIVSDTGWFQFSNTTPKTLRTSAELMEAGLDTDRIYQLLYQNERSARLRLQTRAMLSLSLLAGERLAVMKLTRDDFGQCGANVNDTENLVNVPLAIRTVEASILVSEPLDPGPFRLSLRSKGQVDVARFAEAFGGGGHARAAGLKLRSQADIDAVVTKLARQLEPAG